MATGSGTGTPLGSSARLDDWRIDVDPYLNGCPSPVVNESLRRGLREFCRESEAWRETLSTTTVADQTEYTISSLITGDGRIQRVREIRVSDNALHPSLYTVEDDRTLTFKNALAGSETMEVDVSLLPTERWDTIPDTLADEWGDAPKAWALAHLKAMPRTPWADPDGAQYWRDTYRGYVIQALGLGMDENHLGNVAVKLRAFV